MQDMRLVKIISKYETGWFFCVQRVPICSLPRVQFILIYLRVVTGLSVGISRAKIYNTRSFGTSWMRFGKMSCWGSEGAIVRQGANSLGEIWGDILLG